MNDELDYTEADWYNRFFVASPVAYDPSMDEVKHMIKLVTYDICHPPRLRRIAKICELYGVRIEKSVFECDLPEETFERFWLELMDEIDEEEDSIIAYTICRACSKETLSMGVITRPTKRICYFAGI